MELRVLDDLVAPEGRGVVLLALEEEGASALKNGMTLQDARGNTHFLKTVAKEEGMYTLHFPKADPAYFERLFRDVLVDATRFTFEEGREECP